VRRREAAFGRKGIKRLEDSMKRAVLYLRVSTIDQTTAPIPCDRLSAEAKKKSIGKLCNRAIRLFAPVERVIEMLLEGPLLDRGDINVIDSDLVVGERCGYRDCDCNDRNRWRLQGDVSECKIPRMAVPMLPIPSG
jgi:hypothetical protein